jgi:UDP-N-acetylglucosamine--N-acetylmuramyl-(pentapeptide) pyrophosphoryl-undecaprenol N-acetylglucosamine transferase
LQLIWQTGKSYSARAKDRSHGKSSVWASDFITQMEYAYAAADIIIARSGAMTVAEVCVAQKPVLFVPYPFAAEDHQTVNAMRLVQKGAAMIIKDSEVAQRMIPEIIHLINDDQRQLDMKKSIAAFAVLDADKRIAEEILKRIN